MWGISGFLGNWRFELCAGLKQASHYVLAKIVRKGKAVKTDERSYSPFPPHWGNHTTSYVIGECSTMELTHSSGKPWSFSSQNMEGMLTPKE